jgi:hypothetical protein
MEHECCKQWAERASNRTEGRGRLFLAAPQTVVVQPARDGGE